MIPEKVQRKADEILARYYAKEIAPKRLNGFGKVSAFNVGYSWRLVTWDDGETWDLLSTRSTTTKRGAVVSGSRLNLRGQNNGTFRTYF